MTPKYRLVFFDVDSTLVTIEGIDVLGDDTRVADLTRAAMNGEMPLDHVYARRLEMIRPSRDAVEDLALRYQRSLVPGAVEAIAALRAAGVQIHLVSAGIAQAIVPLAATLGIPERAVHAVVLAFNDDGTYRDFDRRSFLTRTGGKETVVRDVRARTHGKAAFVGDGISDLEAKPAVDLFIGYGGVVIRQRVRDNASVYVTANDLMAVIPYILDGSP
ncbi:MAG TPA: HAD-IB family phosphatase [Thermoanaerobaculia bacterium]|nr:HAD-IB family phosphatase [Thermoanaerobaculia bacterium]